MNDASGSPVLAWFRQDLRLTDNPSLLAAVASGRPVIPVYILDESEADPWPAGGARRWWLHHSLVSLTQALAQRGAPLVLRRGEPAEILSSLAAETGATAIYASRCYEPAARARDRAVAQALKTNGITIEGANAALLHEPWTIRTGAGQPYGVFTPFSRACFAAGPPPTPRPAPTRITPPATIPASDRIEHWGLLPTRPDWAGGLREAWQPSEAGAATHLKSFISGALAAYGEGRNTPGIASTSRLSPYLHGGEIGPAQVWHEAEAAMAAGGGRDRSGETFLKELLWREFSYHLLWHRPELPEQPLRAQFAAFPWREDPDSLRAWQRGQTGYPIVDAGMRELWHTGWMHNRVRMITASFLVKHLLLPWQQGAAWFWDTLVDADLASNSASWQWVAGCGADAAPYFRIFNPVLQGEKFDAGGAYVRRWVPEVAGLPDAVLHKPWEAPAEILRAARVRLGETYPGPIVDHAFARKRALASLATITGDRDAA